MRRRPALTGRAAPLGGAIQNTLKDDVGGTTWPSTRRLLPKCEQRQRTANYFGGEVAGAKPAQPTLGGIPGIFAQAVIAKKSPKVAAHALFAAGLAESGFRDLGYGTGTSEGVLQRLIRRRASLGIDPHDEKAVAEHFLTRGYTGRGGAIRLAGRSMGFAEIATTVQGNATGAGVYSAQGSRALDDARTGLKWQNGKPKMTGTAARPRHRPSPTS